MEKIPTMYPRDESKQGHPVMEPVKPECAWVEAGEGVATRKLDGMNVKIEGGKLFKRQNPKDRDYDRASYIECRAEEPSDKWLWQCYEGKKNELGGARLTDGTYEAIGPKIQGNAEKQHRHTLVRVVPPEPVLFINQKEPRSFLSFKEYFSTHDIEGIVFHHPDGRLAKIKARDFQVGRGAKK